MALVKCLECGNQISEQANNCPKCGKPTESGTFKWQVYLFIAVVCPTIAFFVGYGNFCNDPVANRLWTKKYMGIMECNYRPPIADDLDSILK